MKTIHLLGSENVLFLGSQYTLFWGMTYSNLGAAYQSLGFYEKAIDVLRHSLALNPDSYADQINLAKTYSLTGSMDKALYTYLLILAPNDLTESLSASVFGNITPIRTFLKKSNE